VFVPEVMLKNIEDWKRIAHISRIRLREEHRYSSNNQLFRATFQCFDGTAVYTIHLDFHDFRDKVLKAKGIPSWRQIEHIRYSDREKHEKLKKQYREASAEAQDKYEKYVEALKQEIPTKEGRFTSLVLIADESAR